MFGNSNGKKVGSGFSEQVETIIGKDTQLKGTITASGTIRVDGGFEGDLTTTGDVIIGQSGTVKAKIKARSVTVAGFVSGNVETSDKLELLSSAKLHGDIKVGSIVIGEGAVFLGDCQMSKETKEK